MLRLVIKVQIATARGPSCSAGSMLAHEIWEGSLRVLRRGEEIASFRACARRRYMTECGKSDFYFGSTSF